MNNETQRHKGTKVFNKNLRKSHKNIYVRFLNIFVLYFFVSLCSNKLLEPKPRY